MDCTDQSIRDQRNLAKAVERYEGALAGLLKYAPLNQAAELITSTLDNALCDSLGNAGATRYWQKHLRERCGTEAVRGAGGMFASKHHAPRIADGVFFKPA